MLLSKEISEVSMNILDYSVIYKFVLLISIIGPTFVSGDTSSKEKYALELPNCKIPDLELLSDAILPEWNVPFSTSCSPREQIGHLSPETKILKFDTISKYESCCYTEIQRPEVLVSDTYELSACTEIKDGMEVDMTNINSVIVNCTKKDTDPKEKKFQYDFHYNIPDSSPRVQEKIKFWKTKETKPFSVMFLILDSISTSHGLRSMPKAIDYLQKKLDFILYKGYHAVGEPTIENYVPMFLGIPTSLPGWNKQKPSYMGKWDNEPLIWKNFSQSNYVSMWTEDMAYWHTLNFNGRTGFTNKPFDLNTRPYFMLHEKFSHRTSYRLKYGTTDLMYKALNCLDGKNVYDFMLDYTFEFHQKFVNVPTFSVAWPSWPNHDFLPATQKLDEPISDFFKNLETKTKVLDNTIVIFMGDHGFRWSNYSETKEGLLERNLPLFMIRLPPKFAEVFPEAAKEVKTNSERLTSHFDLFQTLVHLHELQAPDATHNKDAGYVYGYNQSYGSSLFRKIPASRTCDDANIPQAFCSCNFPLFDEKFDVSKHKKSKVVEGLSTLAASSKTATTKT